MWEISFLERCTAACRFILFYFLFSIICYRFLMWNGKMLVGLRMWRNQFWTLFRWVVLSLLPLCLIISIKTAFSSFFFLSGSKSVLDLVLQTAPLATQKWNDKFTGSAWIKCFWLKARSLSYPVSRHALIDRVKLFTVYFKLIYCTSIVLKFCLGRVHNSRSSNTLFTTFFLCWSFFTSLPKKEIVNQSQLFFNNIMKHKN